MLFNSIYFVAFVAIVFTLYYIPVLRKAQVLTLIVSSLLLYSYHQPYLMILLSISILINSSAYYFLLRIKNEFQRKAISVGGIIANLGFLIFFKYSSLIASSLSLSSGSALEFLLSIPLPIGISFYTFHGISLLVDTYRRPGNVNFNLVTTVNNVSLYLVFFPQLVAGPIVRSKDFMPQIQYKFVQDIEWTSIVKLLITGYFLKMFVADNLKDQTFWIAYPYFMNKSCVHLLFMMFGYSMQIFADFAGYSLIALGLARIFGYQLITNFYFPYIAHSFSDFWKRWHISLSTWLREYLYIPLGGNRKGNTRTYINLFIVMFLGGLWHGASWSYAIWGCFHGVLLALEKFLEPKETIPRNNSRIRNVLKGLLVFSMVTLAWLLFKLPDISDVAKYLKAIYTNRYWEINDNVIYIILFSLPVVFYHLYYLLKRDFGIEWKKAEPALYGMMLFLIVTNSGSPGDFIYFQF